MRLAFHPFAQQNAFRRCDDHRGADLISDVVLLAPTWANAYFIRGYCLQDLHRLAEAKKAIAQAVALSPNVLPESRTRRFSLQFPQTPGYAKRPWFLVTRCLIVYYELLTHCYLGVGNGVVRLLLLSQA